MSTSLTHDCSLFKKDGSIHKKYITDVYYMHLLQKYPQALNLARLVFLNVQHNNDLDNLVPQEHREEYLKYKSYILPVIQALEIHRICALPKGKYKAEIAKITAVVTRINRSALQIVEILGSLHTDASVEVSIDCVQGTQMVCDGKKITLTRKDISTIIQMVEQMNQRLKIVIRGSKRNELFRPSFAPSSNNNFLLKKKLYYNSPIFARFLQQRKIAEQRIIDFPKNCLFEDTIGFTRKTEDEVYSFYALVEQPTVEDILLLSDFFYKGYFKGCTFLIYLSILNCHFCISEWYKLLSEVAYPLHINTENLQNIVIPLNQEDRDIMVRIRDSDLIRHSIVTNVRNMSLHELTEKQKALSASRIIGKDRNTSFVQFLNNPDTALMDYIVQDLKYILVNAENHISAADVLAKKPKHKLCSSNMDILLPIIATEYNPSESVQQVLDQDYETLVEHQQRILELRENMSKMLYVEYMKREIKRQIQRLQQVGATIV